MSTKVQIFEQGLTHFLKGTIHILNININNKKQELNYLLKLTQQLHISLISTANAIEKTATTFPLLNFLMHETH